MPIQIKEKIPLKDLTTLKVGGNARYFAEVKHEDELKEAIEFAKARSLPIFVISGGSNILISDEGFSGLVIKNQIKGFKESAEGDKTILTVGAGEDWDKTVERMVLLGLSGLECLSGIPGSVGAAPVQNIGAYGEEVSSVIKEVVALDLKNNSIVKLSKDECKFSYRKSIFNSTEADRYVILEVIFGLGKDRENKEFSYKDLKEFFANKPKPTLKEIRNAVIEIRARKGMVIHPEYESFMSAGSFFKNPVLNKNDFERVSEIIGETEGKWFWNQPDGSMKVSAAKLIEASGYPKGFKMGEAGISPKHSLSLINLGNAKAEDILKLALAIISGVKEKFGIQIEPEVLFVGFKERPL